MGHATAWQGRGWVVSSPEIGCLSAAGVMRCDLYAGCEGCAASAAAGGQPNQRSDGHSLEAIHSRILTAEIPA